MGFFGSSKVETLHDRISNVFSEEEKSFPSFLDKNVERLSDKLEGITDEEEFDKILLSERDFRDIAKHLSNELGREWLSGKYKDLIDELKEEQFS